MKRVIVASILFFVILMMAITGVAEETVTTGLEGNEEPKNYIVNGSFEMGPGGQWGAIPGWTMNIPVGSMDLYIGNYYYDVGRNAFPSDTYIALRKEANPMSEDEVSVTQTVDNLPVGVYEFSAWMWAAQNTEYFTIRLESADDYAEIEGFPGVRDYDSTEIVVKGGSLTITIAANNVDKSRWMDALADDLTLIQIKGEEALETHNATPTATPSATPSATSSEKPKLITELPATPESEPERISNKGNTYVLPIILSGIIVALLAIIVVLVVKLKRKNNKHE